METAEPSASLGVLPPLLRRPHRRIFLCDIPGIVKKISHLRDQLDGPGDLDPPLVDAQGQANRLVLDANGIAFSRTTRQVPNIAPHRNAGANCR